MLRKSALAVVLSMVVSFFVWTVAPQTALAVDPVFRAAATANTTTAAAAITVPASVQSGDQLILIITANSATTATTPAGWTLRGTAEDGSPDMRSWVFTRAAVAGTAGSTVTSTLGASVKVARTLLAYTGASSPTSVTSSLKDTSTTALAAPSAAVAGADTAVINYWSDKTSENSGWTLPGTVTSRSTSVGSGSGRITVAAADRMLDAGTASAVTANSSIAGAKGIAWTIVMPSTVSTPQPVAAFTSPCTQRTCTFNGSSSTTPAGTTITNYSWNYGDGTTATGATPAAKTYAANGTYNVVLTVTNSAGATDTETRAITVTAAATVPVAAFTTSCVQRTCTFNGSTLHHAGRHHDHGLQLELRRRHHGHRRHAGRQDLRRQRHVQRRVDGHQQRRRHRHRDAGDHRHRSGRRVTPRCARDPSHRLPAHHDR